ncbi:hypothetical protein QBC38DRAFT_355601 [Podospora fimiseda]|uniref:Uncharacterized protein n=1 Tax=Podospora fimiseda TaxID=252190 RepID=A0AAN7H0N5_9PEZI|nr:hypothetical protein QBC38DRAFT_355601 [Podospora fimiseda]
MFPCFAPSPIMPVVGASVFGALSLVHAWLAWKKKALFLLMNVYAGLAMTAGMLIRCVLARDNSRPRDLTFEAMSLLLAGPISVLSFMLIMTYTRMIWLVTSPEQRNLATLWLPPAFQTTLIATPQILADTIIFLGSGTLVIKPPPRYMAYYGAVLEAIGWISFTILVVRFVCMNKRNKWPIMDGESQKKAQRLGLALCASCALLVVCGVARVFERRDITTLQDLHEEEASLMSTTEWPVYTFEYLPVAAIMVIMGMFYPGCYLPKRLTGFRLRVKGLIKEDEEKRRMVNTDKK